MFWLGIIGFFCAVFVIAFVVILLAARRNAPEWEAARRSFFEQTDYRYTAIASAGLEAQLTHRHVNFREEDFTAPIAGVGALRYRSQTQQTGRQRITTASWSMRVERPLGASWQIVDRALQPSLTGALATAVTGRKRSWKAVYPGPIPTGDAELDARFAVYAPATTDVPRVLGNPELRERLLAVHEVDLVVSPGGLVLSDPEHSNIRAAQGGLTGRLASGMSPGAYLAAVPVHVRIRELLVSAASVSA
jgi:hypothetical protein